MRVPLGPMVPDTFEVVIRSLYLALHRCRAGRGPALYRARAAGGISTGGEGGLFGASDLRQAYVEASLGSELRGHAH